MRVAFIPRITTICPQTLVCYFVPCYRSVCDTVVCNETLQRVHSSQSRTASEGPWSLTIVWLVCTLYAVKSRFGHIMSGCQQSTNATCITVLPQGVNKQATPQKHPQHLRQAQRTTCIQACQLIPLLPWSLLATLTKKIPWESRTRRKSARTIGFAFRGRVEEA